MVILLYSLNNNFSGHFLFWKIIINIIKSFLKFLSCCVQMSYLCIKYLLQLTLYQIFCYIWITKYRGLLSFNEKVVRYLTIYKKYYYYQKYCDSLWDIFRLFFCQIIIKKHCYLIIIYLIYFFNILHAIIKQCLELNLKTFTFFILLFHYCYPPIFW